LTSAIARLDSAFSNGAMKILWFWLLLAPALTFAAPEDHVGDWAKYKLSGAQIEDALYRKAVVASYDPSSQTYVIEESLALPDGTVDSYTNTVREADLYTVERGQQVVADCQTRGEAETYTVNGQTFAVCNVHFPNDASYELMGPFPVYGRAKLAIMNDMPGTQELIDFHWAKDPQKPAQCNCFAIDAGHIKYWGSHAPATSCTGYARDDALTKAHVECRRYSGFPETCVVKKSNCEMNRR
jgi:hypothetical protein